MAPTKTVPLPALREILANMEDPILRAVSYRIDLPVNDGLYAGKAPPLGLSLFEIKLYGREWQRAVAGDYARGERPLSRFWLPRVKRSFPNLTALIRLAYVGILCEICPAGDNPGTYAEAFKRDLDALWFLSDRIHEAGTSVGRTKLEAATPERLAEYQTVIQNRDVEGLIRLLTDKHQESAVIERVRAKAPDSKLHPDIAEHLFRKLVFPLTLRAEALDLIMGAAARG
jgi:chorismate mutase